MRNLFLILLFASGCASAPIMSPSGEPLQTDADVRYMLDLPLKANCGKNEGTCQEGRGVMTLAPARTYNFRGKAPGDAQILTVEDCTGEPVFYKQDNDFQVTYKVPEAVRGRLCYLSIKAYGPKYKQSLSLMDINAVEKPLSAKVLCGQVEGAHSGAHVCQTPVGKLTIVGFDEPVKVGAGPGCEVPKSKDGNRTFEFNVKAGGQDPWCWYVFMAGEKEFRLTVYPYQEYFLR